MSFREYLELFEGIKSRPIRLTRWWRTRWKWAQKERAAVGNVRETFFINQLRVIGDPIVSPVSDFLVGERTFGVGGRNKTQRQIRGVENAFVVKDDIEYGGLNVVPLWQFGMLY